MPEQTGELTDPMLVKLLSQQAPVELPKMEGLTEGRIVHYVLPDGPSAGEHRAAVIVKVWRNVASACQGYCNLMVFLDGANDGTASYLLWKTSKCYSDGKELDTWHWIEKA